MFKLHVEAETTDFLSYLEKEATREASHMFLFSTKEIAAKSISRYMIYFIRKRILTHFFKRKRLKPNQADQFSLYISSSMVMDTLEMIKEKLDDYFQEETHLHFDGFVSFRLKSEHTLLMTAYEEALEDFYEDERESTHLEDLKKFLQNHESTEPNMLILIDERKKIVLRGEEKVYVVEDMNNQDVILSHLISMAPKNVIVNEYHGSLSTESVRILKQLFREKVEFVREQNSSS